MKHHVQLFRINLICQVLSPLPEQLQFSNDYYYVETELNQGTYQLEGLPAGIYQVVAYVREQGADISAGYTYFVPCGLSVDCSDHTLIDVYVYAGQVVEGVDPIDYYAPPGETDWPADPTE